MSSLNELLQDTVTLSERLNINIKGLSLDSRTIKSGDLFFAYPGVNIDRRDFIDDAISNGAVAVLQETKNNEKNIEWRGKVPIISVDNLLRKVSGIAAKFYNYPSKHMTVIGITGTCGKTSICHLLAESIGILENKHNNVDPNKVGIIGTIGNGFRNQLSAPGLTTSDPITIQKYFDEFNKENVNNVVMEASSHALEQGRVANINFNLGVFTNLSHEHMDYHINMESYAKSKHILFETPGLRYGIFNADDPIGLQWLQEFNKRLNICGYSINESMHGNFPLVVAKHISLHTDGFTAQISTPWGDATLKSALLGRFNVSNVLAVVSALCCLGYDLEEIVDVVPELHPVTGRMQIFGGNKQPLVVVDFAHKPEALYQALAALRAHCSGKLYCVFGCGGDRDKTKRPKMAKIAEELADRVIVTNDNVRTEKQENIVADILAGFINKNIAHVEHDRAKAIRWAIDEAVRGDIILIAGKGHEDYQIIGTEKIHYSDIETVQAALTKREEKK